MSKVKSPQDKKIASLARDRRNTYRENPQASRKGIRRGKQRSHMRERRAVSEILSRVSERPEESEDADIRAKTKIVETRRKAFKKRPDSPLGIVIERKLTKRTNRTKPPLLPNS